MMRFGRNIVCGLLIAALLCVIPAGPLGSAASLASLASAGDYGLASVAAKTGTPVDPAAATWAVHNNLDILGVPEFVAATGYTGTGQTIAFVDTGIDPVTFATHAGGGQVRLKDWVDLTTEGTVSSFTAYSAENGYISIGETRLKVGSVQSRSNRYLVGALPQAIVSQMGPLRQVYFVLVDPDAAGIYNAVAIDTDSDLSLEDEFLLRKFSSNQSSVSIQTGDQTKVSVLVADVALDGSKVTFGFDLNGHGTSLAVIACGSGTYPGVAPGANVISVKTVGSQGTGQWADIRRGIEYALSAKASVILVGSVPQQVQADSGWADLQQRVLKAGAQLVMPVGNSGPGAGTINVAGLQDATVLVSGYLPVGSADALFGTAYSADSWYPLASCGPDQSGDAGPLVAAPAVTAVPLAGNMPDSNFVLMEGTSVSAAYAAGAVALLRQATMKVTGEAAPSANQVSRGLQEGASPIPGLAPVEQGSGRLNVARAWDFLKQKPGDRNITLVRKWDSVVKSNGVWVKGTSPGAMPLWVDSFAPRSRSVTLTSSAPWLSFQSSYLTFGPVSERSTLVLGQSSMDPGFYSAEIVANDPATPGEDSQMAVNVAIPQRFGLNGTASFAMRVVAGSSVARQFIRMPETAESVAINMSTLAQGLNYALYNPEGILVSQGAVGMATSIKVGLPEAGLWQVCLFTVGATAAQVDARVDAALSGFAAEDLGVSDQSQYFLARTGGDKYEYTYLGSSVSQEWRQRQSMSLQANTSTQIVFPVTDSSAKTLSVRFGTATGSYLMAYLIRFDAATGKWVDAGKGMTGASGLGEITVSNPPAGNYVVYVEAYSTRQQVYVELDALLLRAQAGDPAPVVGQSFAQSATGTLTVTPRATADEPDTIVVVRASDQKVAGVFKRALVTPGDTPVVQMTGGQGIKTIRAWSRADMKPLDILVTVGTASYQLTEGRVTTGVPDGTSASIATKDGSRILLAQPASMR